MFPPQVPSPVMSRYYLSNLSFLSYLIEEFHIFPISLAKFFSSPLQVFFCIIHPVALGTIAVGTEVLEVFPCVHAAHALGNDVVHIHLGGAELSSAVRAGVPAVVAAYALFGNVPIVTAAVLTIVVHLHDFSIGTVLSSLPPFPFPVSLINKGFSDGSQHFI